MKKQKWKAWELPSEDGLLGLLIDAGGETGFAMFNNDYEKLDVTSQFLIFASTFPIYLAKMSLRRLGSYLTKQEYIRWE